MESGHGNKRMKVVWLCHFGSNEISRRLGKSSKFEFAPWIIQFADIFEKSRQFDIHIVAPSNEVIGQVSIQYNQRVTMHLVFNFRLPKKLNAIALWLNMKTNFFINRFIINSQIKKINPDMIHLFGSENPHYGIASLDNPRIPQLLTIQGIINNVNKSSSFIDYRKRWEDRITSFHEHFGVRDDDMISYVNKVKNNPVFHDHQIAIKQVDVFAQKDKKYDLVFFARIVKEKGIEDLLTAMQIIKEEIFDVTLCIMGHVNSSYELFLEKRIIELGLVDNIDFIGPMNSIKDVHVNVSVSKAIVLPTYADTIPGTILEGFQIGIPVVAYNVGGIPELNKSKETIVLVDKGNVQELGQTILRLLKDESYRGLLVKNARELYQDRWSDSSILKELETIYSKVIG